LSIMGGSGLVDKAFLDEFLSDGIVIADHNHAATNLLVNCTVNNVKTLGWNAVNGGLRIGNGTTVSNQFIRSGDDSLMVWGFQPHSHQRHGLAGLQRRCREPRLVRHFDRRT